MRVSNVYGAYIPLFVFFSGIIHTTHAPHEKQIVVIIPSYNNVECYDVNLDSVFTQEYTNVKAIYIDDCSSDGTGTKVPEYVNAHGWQDRMRFIRNPYNRKAVANLYRVIQECDDDALIVLLDGDDAFAHTKVLSRINEIFSQEDIWAAYAQYMNVPVEKAQELKIPILGYAKPTPEIMFQERNFRNTKVWVWSGCRIFYAWLFKLIKLEDFILPVAPYKGKFFPTSYDAAIMWPFLELGGRRVRFIDEIVLHRNIDTPLNDFKINKELQRLCGLTLLNNPKYHELKHPHSGRLASLNQAKADIVVYVDEQYDVDQLNQWIENLTSHITGYDDIIIVAPWQVDSLEYRLTQSPSNYVLLLDPTRYFNRPLDLTACIGRLEQTYAYGFYLDVDIASFGYAIEEAHKAPCEQLWDDIYAWQFSCEPALKEIITTHTNVLHRKQDTLAFLRSAGHPTRNMHNVGLFLLHKPF